jgi:phage-related protein
MWEIEFFVTANGDCPLKDFLDNPDQKDDLPFIKTKLDRLEEFGNELRYPETKILGKGLYELRVKTHRGIYRLPFFYYKGKIIVLTHGFLKKSDKTPRSEITRAYEYKAEYISRKEKQK